MYVSTTSTSPPGAPLGGVHAPAHQLHADAEMVGGASNIVAVAAHHRPDRVLRHQQAAGEPRGLVLELPRKVSVPEGVEGIRWRVPQDDVPELVRDRVRA